ncbi:sensor histidine kinase [Dictyobacter aurantiacus]|uniref:histidine kinase n=1 Tax=Dictyobacter aurantiacus TaxID=1936993 RepID=A0A401ZJ76_9CHLR|nr:ATP-binding protein [Dictyobacter aurantiacus]GCE06907.1 hypothetical protein KDAU_42360 [Dictyobacter aurantiacus]
MEHVTDQEQENKHLRERIEQLEAELQHVREREERGRVLLQLTSDYAYMYLLLPDGSYQSLWTTEAFTSITGFTPEEFDRRGWENLQHPDDRWMHAPRMEAMRQGRQDTREWRVITRSGEIRWLQDTCYPIVNQHPCDDDTVIRVYGIVRDITQRKQAELQRNQIEQRLSTTFESIADAVVIYDHEGRLIQYNDAAGLLLGFNERPEYPMQSLQERFQTMRVTNAHGRPLAVDELPPSRILRGETLRGITVEDLWITTLTGRQIVISVSGAPIYDAQDGLMGAVLVCRDVTARRNQQWRTSKALETLLSMAEVLVRLPVAGDGSARTTRRENAEELLRLTCDLLGCQMASIVDIDPEKGLIRPIAGVGMPEDLRQKFWERVPSLSLSDYIPAPDMARLQRGEPVLFSLLDTPSGTVPTFGVEQVLGAPIRLRDHLVGFLSINYGTADHHYAQQDEFSLITAIGKLASLAFERERLIDQRSAAQAAEVASDQARQQMDAFLGMTNHELRNPLATMKASLQLIRRQLKLFNNDTVSVPEVAARIQELVERAERQVSVETRLVNDLLDVSRILEHKLELKVQFCNLVDLVSRVVADQLSLAHTRTIDIHLPQEDMVPVVVDIDRVGQVLTNYLTNAIKYSEDDRPIEVSLSVEGEQARVSVKDQGPGLTPEEQRRIWERFYQTPDRQLYSGSGGLGLGLYISQSIIQQHSGRVGIESDPGKGSTFWFTLPLVRD